jgi:hypothetical protein
VIALPPWLDAEAWAAFLAMRKQIKKPASDFAQLLLMKELYRIREAGHDANEALAQSILKCWTDVYPPKHKQIDPASSSDYEKTQARQKAEESRGLTKEQLAENARKVREALHRPPVQRTLQ